MSWCESQIGIDYVLGLAPNNRLLQLAQSLKYRASQEYSKKIKPVVESGLFHSKNLLKCV